MRSGRRLMRGGTVIVVRVRPDSKVAGMTKVGGSLVIDTPTAAKLGGLWAEAVVRV